MLSGAGSAAAVAASRLRKSRCAARASQSAQLVSLLRTRILIVQGQYDRTVLYLQ